MLKSLSDLPRKDVRLRLEATWGGRPDDEIGWCVCEATVFAGGITKADLRRLQKIIDDLLEQRS